MKTVILSLTVALSSSVAVAGTGTGRVLGYIPYSQGTEEIIFINVEVVTDKPPCNTTSRFTMRGSNPRFKATQSAVMAALMAGTQVRATGTGICSNFSNAEDLNYVCLGTTPC